MAKRARILQQIDHPGISRLIDFHSYEQRHLYLVENPPEGHRLAETKADLETSLTWGIQLCNSLIYLQGLMPPLMPPRLIESRFYVSCDSQLILVDYELPYVLGPLSHQTEPENALLHKSFSMDNLVSFLIVLLGKSEHSESSILKILGLDTREANAENLNSVFKVRARLKQALEEASQPSGR